MLSIVNASLMADETEVETVIRIHAVDICDLYPDRSPEDARSRVCLLCGARLKDKTHSLTRHLERHHAGALLQLLEQQKSVSQRALASESEFVQHEKSTEGSEFKAEDAKLALARWLAQEQLPVDLIEKAAFQQFIEALNELFSLPTKGELRKLLNTLMSGTDGSKSIVDRNTIANGDVLLPVDMLALKATCRCSDDVPLVSCSRIACACVASGEVKVKVLRAAASLLDAQTCQGKVLGRNGVLGKTFVGTVSEMQSRVSNKNDAMNEVDVIRMFDRVVSSPFTEPVRQEQHANGHQNHQNGHNFPQFNDRGPSCIGVSASSGALAEYIVLPISNLSVIPAAIPDDLALLSDDMTIVLSIASELQRRQSLNVAILTDGPSTIVSNLLMRYLHQAMLLAPQNLHVFSTYAASSSVWSQHASLVSLDFYRPEVVAEVMERQTELALDAIVDLIGSEASTVFATELVRPMGCIVLADRSRLELNPQIAVAMDMNSVVVKELEIISVYDCRNFLNDALQYLATQATNEQSVSELRECLLNCVQFSHALRELETIPERALEARYLQVKLT